MPYMRHTASIDVAFRISTPTPHVYEATNTSLIAYEGNWTVLNDPLIPSRQHPAPYLVTSVPSASLSFSFQGVGVAMNGSRIWGSSVYNVVRTYGRSGFSSCIDKTSVQTIDNQTETYNASTMWFIGDALLFYRDGLDPHQIHTVNVTPILAPGGFLKFWLNTVTVFTDDPSEVGGLLRYVARMRLGRLHILTLLAAIQPLLPSMRYHPSAHLWAPSLVALSAWYCS